MINSKEWEKLIKKSFNVKSPSVDELSLYRGGFTIPNLEKKIERSKEWVWVEGYKGTDENMCCRGYQFELGKQHDMDCEDEEISLCNTGFHLCKELTSVFNYYPVGANNRYFKVKALIEKRWNIDGGDWIHGDKLVAKSIIFEEEVSDAEVLKAVRECERSKYIAEIDDEHLKECRSIGVDNVVKNYLINILIQDGYSETFAKYLIEDEGQYIFKCAHVLGSMNEMSMDKKVELIFTRLSSCDD